MNWLIVCKHLIANHDQGWYAVGDPLQGYVCGDCDKRVPELTADDLEPVAEESLKRVMKGMHKQ